VASRVTRAQSPAVRASAGVSQDPPTHATFGNARNSRALPAVMPPVGQNLTSLNGPCQAFSMPAPAGVMRRQRRACGGAQSSRLRQRTAVAADKARPEPS
jgi:hypothetical protein